MKLILNTISCFTIFSLVSCNNDDTIICQAEHKNYSIKIIESVENIGISTKLEIWQNSDLIKTRQLDDDVPMANPRIVISNDWIYVSNENLLWGGFNISTKEIYGEHQWKNLPHQKIPKGALILQDNKIKGRRISKPSGRR